VSPSSPLTGLLFAPATEAAPRRVELSAELGALSELRGRLGPCAVVLDEADLERCRALGPEVVDRGAKEPSKGLGARLLGHQPRIPLTAAHYSLPGRVEQGIGALLRAAERRGEANLYLVGVTGPVFRALCGRAPDPSRPPGA